MGPCTGHKRKIPARRGHDCQRQLSPKRWVAFRFDWQTRGVFPSRECGRGIAVGHLALRLNQEAARFSSCDAAVDQMRTAGRGHGLGGRRTSTAGQPCPAGGVALVGLRWRVGVSLEEVRFGGRFSSRRSVGLPTSTRGGRRRTSIVIGRNGRRRPGGRRPTRPTSGAECTVDRTGRRSRGVLRVGTSG